MGIKEGMILIQATFDAVCKNKFSFEQVENIYNGRNFKRYHSLFFCVGKMLGLINKNHDLANEYLIISISIVSSYSVCSAYYKAAALIVLSKNCYLNKQYHIGLKVLKSAYKIAKGRMMPSFVNDEYDKKKKGFEKKMASMKCSYCGKECKRLKACKGCMKMTYCSVLCQKYDWNKKHRFNCDGYWESKESDLYKILKMHIFNFL